MKHILLKQAGKSFTTLLPIDNIAYINEMSLGCDINLKSGERLFVNETLNSLLTRIINATR